MMQKAASMQISPDEFFTAAQKVAQEDELTMSKIVNAVLFARNVALDAELKLARNGHEAEVLPDAEGQNEVREGGSPPVQDQEGR